MSDVPDLRIPSLGPCRVDSPIHQKFGSADHHYFVDDADRVLLHDRLSTLQAGASSAGSPVGFELAGPRGQIYFDPSKLRCGIVTCGSLCPGMNDVIRGLVMALWHRYGVRQIIGFRYGYEGFIADYRHPVTELSPSAVAGIHQTGGTILGTSRSSQDREAIVDCLDQMNIGALFVIGGAGATRDALALGMHIADRDLKIGVVGVPKAIGNNFMFVEQSFGFQTAYAAAVETIRTTHVEVTGRRNGVGVIQLMGRHAGFVACHAALASGEVNFVLIPEVPFALDGKRGLLRALQERIEQRGHAVLVVADGAWDSLVGEKPVERRRGNGEGRHPRGNIGRYLSRRIAEHSAAAGLELSLEYVDPGNAIRSLPASAADSIYCWRLAQGAVHAALAGRTAMIVGQWHGRTVHVPMKAVVSDYRRVDPNGSLWLSVLEDTGQPVSLVE